MIETILSLVGIPLGIGVVLTVCCVGILRIATSPKRGNWKPGEIAGATAGLLIFGFCGYVGGAAVALFCGVLPFLGSRGHPALAAMMAFAGAIAIGLPGAWIVLVLVRHYPKQGVFQRHADAGSLDRLREILARVPDMPPEPGDELPRR